MALNATIEYNTEINVNIKLLKSVYKSFPCNTMPFLTKSIKHLKKHKPYNGLKIVHNLHITSSTICKIIPLLYSGAFLTMTKTKELQVDKNILNLIKRANVNFIEPKNLPNDFDISLDCGGGLSKLITPRIGCAELTQSGKAKYIGSNLTYPVISVDESNLKKLETFYGTGDGFIRSFIEITKENIKDKKFVLFGYGKVGSGIVNSIKDFSKNITIVEIENNKIQQLIKDGYNCIFFSDHKKILEEVKTAFCVITATGEKGVLSKLFTQNDFASCKYLANMGTEDEFGNNFSNDKVLCNKAPINFSISVPTLSKFLDPIFYAHNFVIDLLLTKKFPCGFQEFPFNYDMQIIKEWEHIYKTKFDI